jgi:N-acetylglucosaminyldiphosphoundecaprenol N-acetyl-beta-D-mannosaminyltransferase
VYLLNTPVDRVERTDLPTWIAAYLDSGKPHQIITANLDFIAIALKRPTFARVIAEADLVLCDGKPLQWAARLQGIPIPSRVTGMDLVLQTALLSAQHGYRIFLLGGQPGIAEQAARQIQHFIPDTVIAGCYSPPHGPFSAQESAWMVEVIRAARPDALFVAFGAPRQDEWIYEQLHELDVPLCAGVGAVFDFLSGKIRRAPEWMQRAGLEWTFRLAQEPSRLWRRYLVNDLPVFLTLVGRQMRPRARRELRSSRPAARSGGAGIALVAAPERVAQANSRSREQATQELSPSEHPDATEITEARDGLDGAHE